MDARMDARMNARTDASTPGRAGPRPYDPAYDPLVSPPGQGQDYAPTYWVATAGSPPQDDGPVNGDMEVDVAVVGSGFTGLSAALTLARDYGVRAVVLEANRAVWGCTSRNGGQGQNASGRLYRSQWIQRWGWTRPAGWTPRSARVSNTGRAWWRRWTATRSRAAICTRRIGRRRWPSWRTRAASCARSSATTRAC